jgi:hypothetical protein
MEFRFSGQVNFDDYVQFNKDSIYIFLSTNMAKLIKKRFFEHGEEYDNLVLFITEHYKDKIKKK